MEIRVSKGCYTTSLCIDDILAVNVSQQEKIEIVKKLADIVDSDQLESIIRDVCELLGDYIPEKESCEQCGSWNADYVLEID